MESLVWQQDAGGLHVMVCDGNGGQCRFTIDNSLINYLLAGTPRIYHVFLQLNGSDQDVCYVLDLSLLKPVIQKNNALKMTLGRKSSQQKVVSGVSVGRYCLARGESYHDRFLSNTGWQSQRLYQDVYSQQSGVQVVAPSSLGSADPITTPSPSTQSAPRVEQPSADLDLGFQTTGVTAPPAQQDDDFDLDLTL